MTHSHQAPSASQPVYTRLLAMGGLLLALALRLHNLGAESLWYDETVSVFLARQSIPDLIAHTARDIHPPGYYLLLHVWGWLAQPTLENGLEFLYAWPSLLWGVLLLPLIYVIGRRLFSDRVALVALWLAAVNPYHIWYSQEVRMYTLGAGLGLICLWTALVWLQSAGDGRQTADGVPPIRHSLTVYALAAAAGLYTLYYFAFLLIALNLLVIGHSITTRRSPIPSRRSLFPWLLANAAAFLLWSPWLPTFWRQVTDPPVPPWRAALNLTTAVQESLAALLVGQSPPLGMLWPWALAGGALLALALIGSIAQRAQGTESSRSPRAGVWTVLVFVFLPLLLIVAISLTVTPLYHIRYFFTYAAVGVLLIALALEYTASCWRWLHAIALVGVIGLSGWSLNELWNNPLHRADDHRAAVAQLARAWRPGDAILVNAGWVYTALAVYWPTSPSASGSQPLSPPVRVRLLDYTNGAPAPAAETPLVLMGGSVDGAPDLGWGLPDSDFYAMTATETQAALAAVAARHPRLWHYRLYDTVSDPQGTIRAWLDSDTTQRLDLPYPGRDFLRLQMFETPAFDDPVACPQTPERAVTFGDGVRLRGVSASPAPRPGSMLYATLCWRLDAQVATQNLRTSLRLYRATGDENNMVAQHDEAPFTGVTTRKIYHTVLALPLPANTAPGDYRLQLIVYDGTTGDPLPIHDPRAIFGQRWPLAGTIRIEPP